MRPARLLLADDHAVVRKGLRYLLEVEGDLEVVGEAADGLEAVRRARELRPDLVILDLAMPLLSGIEATAEIVASLPNTRVIVLSMHLDESYLTRSLTAGARAYLLKGSAEDDLIRAVRAVLAGEPFFSPGVLRRLMDGYLERLHEQGLEDPYEQLTAREKQILQLLAQGKSNKEAAALLELGVSTVETHRANLMQKLGLHNTAEIVLYAVRKKLVT